MCNFFLALCDLLAALKNSDFDFNYVFSHKQEIQKNYADSIDLQLMKAFLVFSYKQKSDIEATIFMLVKLADEQHVGFNFRSRWCLVDTQCILRL